MAKVTAPFLSLDASGTVAGTLTASKWKGINYMRQRVIPKNPNSVDQQAIRMLISDSTKAWKTNATVGGVIINPAYKLAYNNAVTGLALSGFNLYVKQCVAFNGGSSYSGTLKIPASPTA